MSLRNRVFGREASELDEETVAHLLSNGRRQGVLSLLSEREEVDLSDAAEEIAVVEGNDGVELQSDIRENVYIALHQCHLPKMEDHGVVVYDRDRKWVRRGHNFGDVKRGLRALRKALR